MTGVSVHIYVAKDQPATRYAVDMGPGSKKIWIKSSPRARLWCFSCKKLRIAKNLIAHVYYDGTVFYCRRGKGCKA